MCKSFFALFLPLAVFAQGGFDGPGRYEIYSNLSKKVLDLDRNDRRTVIQFESRGTDNQTWDITDAGGGLHYIRNGMNGYALTQTKPNNSEPVAGQPLNQSDAQKWRFESGSNGSVIIVNASGKALDIPYGSTDNGVKINTYDRNNEINQQWSFRRVSGGGRYNDDRSSTRQDRNGRGNRGQSRYENDDDGRYADRGNAGQRGRGRGRGQGRDAANRDKYFDEREQMWKMDGDGACFYTGNNYRGEAFCMHSGAEQRRLSGNWNNSFNSVRLFGNTRSIQVYDQEDMRGRSNTIDRDIPNMRRFDRGNWNNRVTSLRVE